MSEIPVNILPARKQLIQVLPLGDEMPYDFKRPHRHEYYEFFLFEEGGGTHYIDFASYVIGARTVHIIFPGQIHLLKRAGARGKIIICLKEFMSSLDSKFLTQLYQQNYAAPCLSFDIPGYSELSSYVEALVSELEEVKPFFQELAKCFMSVFLGLCLRRVQPGSNHQSACQSYPHHDLLVFQKFTRLLEAHFMNKPNVSFYAQEMGITPKTLNQCIKKLTGKTCVGMIQERTLIEAKRRLLYSDESSKEIAYHLNFKDNSYFTRFFTRLEGKTPTEFKAYWEEKYRS